MPAANRTRGRDRRLTVAGLVAISAATLLMMAWAIFPSPAFADGTHVWGVDDQKQGANNLPCANGGHWNFQFTGTITAATLHVGSENVAMTPQGNHFTADTSGPVDANTSVSVTWTGSGDGKLLALSHCLTTTTTTTTTTPVTTTTTTPTSTSTTTTTTTTTSPPPEASFKADAGSSCVHSTGHVDIHVTVENTGNIPLQVTVTDLSFAGGSASAAIQPGQSHTFHLDAGPSPLPGGQVRVDVVFQGGSDSTIVTHSPTKECGPTTTTTPVTTTTTTPPITTTTTTTPGGVVVTTTTTTPTSSPTIAPTTVHPTKTKTETVAPTTVRPGGTAFTGFEDVVPLGLVALTLMTGGSGLLWAGTRRRRNLDEGDE